MSALCSFFSQEPKKRSTYYIVKDDFITNLKKGRPSKPPYIKTEEVMGSDIEQTVRMVSKKVQLQEKIKTRSNNNFYDLDQQIKDNRMSLYRKLNVALRKSRVECKIKLQNPFVKRSISLKESKKRMNHQDNLSKLIFNVQPFWVKRGLSKTLGKQR